MKALTLSVTAALLVLALAHAHEARGPNGGRLVDAGEWHVELVANDKAIEVYVSDANEKPVPATGFRAVAILAAEGKTQRIVLEPKEATRLSGNAGAALPAEPKGALQLNSPDGKTAIARFE
jgi:hypothetical protein